MTIRDITERKKVEAERRLSEERFKDIVSASADWFWETDENERFTYLPGRYQFITGVDPSTVLGKTWKEIDNGRAISPEVVAQLEELEALCRERKPYRDQRLDVLTPDGQIRHWRISAKPVFDEHGVFRGYRGGTTDVTQIIEAEDSLHKSEAMLRRSQKIARIGTWEWDEVNQNTLWTSEEAARIFGRRPDDRNGLPRNILDRIHPDDREIYRQHMLDTREHPRPYQIAYRLRRSDGEVIHVEEMALPQFDEVGRLVAYSGTIQDVTERAHAEQQLRQSQKMEVVGQLTGGIAHDFNNLLAIILGNAQLIEQRLGDEDDIVKDLLGSILRSAFRGGDLTQRLLAFSRKQALLPASIDLNEHVLNMTEILHRSIDATIEIKVAAEAGLWRCSADPGQLESAILNLAINARDAMPNGGKLTIKTANAPLDRAYADSQEEVTPGDYAMVAITDTGVGIQPEELEHVFEPFYTTKDVGEGSGLGLSMVYGFAKQSGGHVAIHSEIDQGTTVRLYLPCAQDARPPTRPAVPEGEPAGRGETLLVVEDDAELRKVTAGLLEDLGYVVLEASDGASAMTVFEENNGIDLLLTDVVLPGGVDGGKLAKDILVRNGEIKVLYMSGYTEDVTNDQHNLDSEIVLLQKPFSKCDLAVKVRMMLDTASG
jgi:PAS domain S-box-containing protein